MALPIKPSDTQSSCNPISSNCVIWQGPDIPCIDLCHGDTVSDVVAKLASELCDLLDNLDISNFNLSCFNPVCPTINNLEELIQFIIDKLCELQNNAAATATAGCQDCEVEMASCFYYTDPVGDTITTMQLNDYVKLIGQTVCTLDAQTKSVTNVSLAYLEQRITTIEETCCTTPTEPVSTVSCLRSLPPGGAPVTEQLEFVEDTLCDLLAATGTDAELQTAIAFICASLDSANQLSNPGNLMSDLTGWILSGNYDTVADAITNLWLTVCDMRAEVVQLRTELDACCGVTCADMNLSISSVTYNSGTGDLEVLIAGTVPSGYTDSGTSTILVTGSNGVSQGFTINATAGLQTVSLTGSPVLNSLYFNVQLNAQYDDGAGNNCNQTLVSNNITGDLICPTVNWLDTTAATISYQIAALATTTTTYTITFNNLTTGLSTTTVYTINTNTTITQGSGAVPVTAADNLSVVVLITQGAYSLLCAASNNTAT